ncbi:hypothetical protein [Turicibacter sp. TJ11]|uniref:hypothetical protein n=1 Tax=Turicibacter sp. TJ11 TaxID=2806443 RepID=UPI001F2C595D|nr:hypothetical protein [Turicibacter sp. TJ11]
MKKLLTIMFFLMFSLTANKTTLASEVTVHDPNIQVIVEEGNSLLTKSMKNVDHYEDVYSRALSRPTSAHHLSSPYYFEVRASRSDIYSNYYFTGHTGRINFHFEEYYGPEVFKKTFKVYVYEQGTNKEMFNVALKKGDASTIYALNLSTSKGYYFKVVPNGQTNINGKVYR